MDYFAIFSLPVAFEIDLSALEAAYFKAQRQFHPDRFVGKPATEKLAALQKSMDINKAYETLKDPLKRARYLLSLQGIIVGTANDSIRPSPALLTEIMELREEEVKLEEIELLKAECLQKIAESYKQSDFEKMAQEVLRLGYLLPTKVGIQLDPVSSTGVV